jgi:CheY-like chemotaxis protein
MKEFDPALFERGYGSRFQRFQDLMTNRVHDILLVSSIYDSFILEEDGRLEEGLINEYLDLNLVHLPRMIRASSGSKALQLAREQRSFDLIITTMHLGDMHAIEFAREVREAGVDVPVVLLTYDYKELQELVRRHGKLDFTKVFLWQGDFRILIAIVKYIEDYLNVDFDTNLVGVQSIIVIEDNVRFYSSFLPLIYTELMHHSQSVLSESVNLSHRILRMRARSKILLCETYEEAWSYFERYHENILGVISDIEFPREGRKDPTAGVEFARTVRRQHPDIPILLQSSNPANRQLADSIDVQFLHKNSPLLLHQLRQFMVDHLSFGDFIFKMPEGAEVARATDLRSLENCLHLVPDECLLFHSRHNHFSNWLKARTEFWLAYQLRPRTVSDYESVAALRADLIKRLRDFRQGRQRGTIVDFDPAAFDTKGSFARIGGGSLGGKGRGLAFVSTLVETYTIGQGFPDIEISVPSAVVLGTDVFDRFLDKNDLRDFAIESDNDQEIIQRFLNAHLPDTIVGSLRSFLELMHEPLAVRSSSLLEDSQHQPFAGIYATYMLANNAGEISTRLDEVLDAVKLVYASTFFHSAKAYMQATPYRLEEEKMAVLIQRLIGRQYDNRFYPDFAGVARSHNYYPLPPMKSSDGIASVALGLGFTVVEGGRAVRFSPRYPKHLIQFSTVEDTLNYSQREFYALDLSPAAEATGTVGSSLVKCDISVAEHDGVLDALASTYSLQNDAIYDGTSRAGARIVSFAPVLKNDLFPLARVIELLLEVGKRSMSSAVEIEFAVNLRGESGKKPEFSILQMRPMVVNHEWEEVLTGESPREEIICESDQVLGNGIIKNIYDIVLVNTACFNRSMTRTVAGEIALFNFELTSRNRPYLLIGVGRWGSADPWLGIPVGWEQISGARVIVEASFQDLRVQPSQGSHFFQNLATMEIGYFTIDGRPDTNWVDWAWLLDQPVAHDRSCTRHLRFAAPLTIKMDGRRNHGIVLKPK